MNSTTKIQYTKSFTIGQPTTTVKVQCTDGTNWSEITEATFYFRSDISYSIAAFDPANPADITVTMRPYGNTLTAIRQGEYTLTPGTDYTLSGNAAIISKAYLADKCGSGPIDLTFEFSSGNSVTATIPVLGAGYQDSAVTPEDYGLYWDPCLFDKNPDGEYHRDLYINIEYNGNTLTHIRNGHGLLKPGTDYKIEENKVTIFTSYLEGIGSSKLSFDFSTGNTAASVDVPLTIINTAEITDLWGLTARFCFDDDDNLYFMNASTNYIYVKASRDYESRWGRKVEAGKTYILAGTGKKGYSGDGGPGVEAAINLNISSDIEIATITADHDGNVFFVNFTGAFASGDREKIIR
jgi:hypothetical protein